AGNGIALRGMRNTATNNVIHDVDYLGTYARPTTSRGVADPSAFSVTHAAPRTCRSRRAPR
ncbi:hypothetical protein ACWEJ6_46915, partial [Nonomuraea sp. NPDC004702]